MKSLKSMALATLILFTSAPMAGFGVEKEPTGPFVLEVCEASPIESQEIIDHMYVVQDVVNVFSNGAPAVLKTSRIFMEELYHSFCAGEGMSDKDFHHILNALQFAAKKHQGQMRKDEVGTPYIIHPIQVAHHLFTVGGVRDADILMAALLHDTVEDTDATFEEIRTLFGPRVEGFVREVSDDKSLPKEERKKLQIVHASAKSAGAAQIKLGDKFCNLSDLLKNPPKDWSKERIDAYFDWAEQVVSALPAANPALKSAVEELVAEYRQSK